MDDTSKVLYKRNDEETKFFYLRSKVPKYMVIESKILYVYSGVPISKGQNMMMLDKYGLEWEILLSNEVKDLTYLGMPIVRVDKEAGTSFDFMYRKLGPISMPTPTGSPISILRPTMSGPRVLFVEPIIPLTRMGGYRLEGSMGASSGNSTIRVPIGPLPLTPSHTPILTSRFRPRGSMGVPTRHKTRLSHFQKWN